MTTPNKDTLLDFLKTLDPIPQDLINQLNEYPQATITKWMARTEAHWLRRRPDDGDDIYNHLNPSPKLESLISSRKQDGIGPLASEFAAFNISPSSPGLNTLLGTERAHILKGSSAQDVKFCDFFEGLGGYIDRSRAAVISEFEWRIKLLVANQLKGQMNCFLILGMHGVGKSQFLIEFGRWSVHIASPSHAFLFLPCDDKVAKSSLSKTIYDVAKHLGWINDEPMWSSISVCLEWLKTTGRTLLIVLDEFENIYRVGGQVWTSDLARVGEISGPRSIVVILCGSAAHLRPLCFKKMDHTECGRLGFPGYHETRTLNSSKFLPLALAPLSNTVCMKKALAALGTPNLDDDDVWDMCCRTRGRIRYISNVCMRLASDESRDNLGWKTDFFNLTGDRKTVMELLWKYTKEKLDVRKQADIVSLSGLSENWSITLDVSSVQGIQNVGTLLYGMADAGLIRFSGAGSICFAGQPSFGFAHPFDLWICSVLFDDFPNSEALNRAEMLSLRMTFNVGASDINERLVVESFCEKNLKFNGYPTLNFVDSFVQPCFTGYLRETKNYAFGNTPGLHDPIHPLNPKYLGKIDEKGECVKPAHFRKEYPDEAGGDSIAVFTTENGRYDYLVVRVQVKLGLSEKDVKDPVSKMISHEDDLIKLMDAANRVQVRFLYVLWTSQPHGVKTADNICIINSETMQEHWSEKVKQYVQQEQLKPYGFKE